MLLKFLGIKTCEPTEELGGWYTRTGRFSWDLSSSSRLRGKDWWLFTGLSGQICYTETPVSNYQSAPHNVPEEHGLTCTATESWNCVSSCLVCRYVASGFPLPIRTQTKLLNEYSKNQTNVNMFRNCSRNNQHYALISTTPLFYILAPTCFGSSLQSSESFLDPSELLEIQIDWVVYHIMCGYVTCVLECPRHSDAQVT
jgi:hypothetical protein